MNNLKSIHNLPILDNDPGLGYNNSSWKTNGEAKLQSSILLPHNGIVFDIGAAMGEWTKNLVSQNLNKELDCFLFEPTADFYNGLSKQKNKFANICVRNVALGSKTEEREFFLASKGKLSSFYRRSDVQRRLGFDYFTNIIQVETLDGVCDENHLGRIDFLKIDTEGAELEVLLGGKGLLSQQRIKFIQFEYGGTYLDAAATLEQIYDLLTRFGYTIFRIFENGLIHIPEWRPELENYNYSNYFAAAGWAAGSWKSKPIQEKAELPDIPDLSILMPVYNSGKYLPETFESILAQSLTNFEIIVVDDGSEDESIEIIRKYADKDNRIQPVYTSHNGVVQARNITLKKAHPGSMYLMNHDSDDISEPDKIEKIIGILEKRPDIDILGCRSRYFGDPNSEGVIPKIDLDPITIRKTYGRYNSVVNSAAIIRKNVFETIGKYNKNYSYAQDYEFFSRALQNGFTIQNIPDILHHSRIHSRSITQKRNEQIPWAIFKIRLDYDLWRNRRFTESLFDRLKQTVKTYLIHAARVTRYVIIHIAVSLKKVLENNGG